MAKKSKVDFNNAWVLLSILLGDDSPIWKRISDLDFCVGHKHVISYFVSHLDDNACYYTIVDPNDFSKKIDIASLNARTPIELFIALDLGGFVVKT